MRETCTSHPGVEAVGTCHSCGKPFCEECLAEGLENRYCADADCRVQRERDDAILAERNRSIDLELETWVRMFDSKLLGYLVGLWLVAAPLFVYLGSDGWTANMGVASAMGPLGALVLCLQLRSLVGIYKRRYVKRRRAELMSRWAQCGVAGDKDSQTSRPATSI